MTWHGYPHKKDSPSGLFAHKKGNIGMKVTNNKMCELSPAHIPSPNNTFDPTNDMKAVLVRPLFTPLVAGTPCTINDGNHDLSEDDILDIILDCCGEHMDPLAEDKMKDIMSKCLVSYNKKTTLLTKSLFVIQSATKEKLPEPTAKCIYTPATDIIPVSKEFLSGKCSFDKYFATMAFFTKCNIMGFYFANEVAFDNFKQWLASQVALIAGTLSADVNQLFSDFQNLKLTGLVESVVLRNDDSDNNDPNSFARQLMAFLMTYATQTSPGLFGPMPFDIGELFCPKNVAFINVDAHSKASSKQINDEWDIVQQSLKLKPTVLKNGKITKLTSAVRGIKKAQAAASAAYQPQQKSAARAKLQKFRKTPLKQKDIVRYVTFLLNKMMKVNRSQNIYKQTKMSFARPNRRDPDDFNKMGKTVSIKYWPDIHIYLDTSGSVSEENYSAGMRTCVMLAHKLNVNLYFNSFSSVMSECTLITTKDRNVEDCYRQFMLTPKVTGGTNFEQIWHYINGNRKRERELSLVMTDFEWTARSDFVKHPENLYYLPFNNMDWDSMLYWMKAFAKSMLHNDPEIRKHILA